MKTRHLHAVAMMLASLATTALAAEPDAASKAIAAQLFDDAHSLLEKGSVAQACEKYAESQRLDPQLGTMLYLADCYAQLGRNASAWASFKDAVDIATQRRDPREAAARARLTELEPKVCKLTVRVGAGAPADMSITSNDRLISSALLGSAMPVDPGEYVLVARAEGFEDWVRKIQVTPDTLSSVIDVPVLVAKPLEMAGPKESPIATAVALDPEVSRSPVAEAGAQDSRTFRRKLGYVIGAVGVAGLGMGVGFGLAKESKQSERDSANACSKGTGCTEPQRTTINQLTSEARTRATFANIGFIAGGAALVSGTVLVLTAWPESNHNNLAHVTPWVGDKAAGLTAGGSW